MSRVCSSLRLGHLVLETVPHHGLPSARSWPRITRSFAPSRAVTSSRGDDSRRPSWPQDAADGTRARGNRGRGGSLADGGCDSVAAMVLTVLLPDDVRLGPAWALPVDRRRTARRGDRRRSGLDHASLARAARALDRARVRSRARGAVVDGAADRRPRPREPADELGQRPARGRDRSCGCRTPSRSHCSTGSSMAAARLPAPTSRVGHPDLAFPQQLNPIIGPPGLAPAVRRLPLPQLHQLDRVQPDRRDAVGAMGQACDGRAGGDLARRSSAS